MNYFFVKEYWHKIKDHGGVYLSVLTPSSGEDYKVKSEVYKLTFRSNIYTCKLSNIV